MGPDPARTYNLPVEGSPVKGPADAPVTIVEFSDYQCPFCARTRAADRPGLAAYPKQARFVYKHIPLPDPSAARCPPRSPRSAAQKQGKFWEMHDKLFANQQALSTEQIEQYAREIGLDMAKFKEDIDSEEVKAQVEADCQLARRAGVRGRRPFSSTAVCFRIARSTVSGRSSIPCCRNPSAGRGRETTPRPRRDG